MANKMSSDGASPRESNIEQAKRILRLDGKNAQRAIDAGNAYMSRNAPAQATFIEPTLEARQAEIDAQVAGLQSAGGQAAIPLAEGLSAPIAAPAPVERAPAQTVDTSPAVSGGLMAEAAALDKQGKESAAILDEQQANLAMEENIAEIKKQEVQAQIDAKIKEIDDTKIEPKSFYSGKSTGQKIAAGIGLFFAALTPEGARNAIAIIDNGIERDMQAQRANLGKKQSTLSDLEKKLGSIGAAESAFRLKSLQNIELQLKSTAEKAKGPLARAKAQQGMEAIQAQRASEQQKLSLELYKVQAKQGTEKKMGGEEMKRFDAARDAKLGIQSMRQSLAAGQNTFTLFGDNDFTVGLRNFAENYGRMQSGGAINKEEEERFMAMAPTYKDSPKMQEKKLRDLEAMVDQRLKTLGKDPTETTTGLKGINFRAK